LTHALLDGSDAIDVAACIGEPADQRGVLRPQGSNCDIGAYEFADADGDGIADERDAFPNNPAESADTDGDLMGDNFEIANGLDPNLNDAGLDADDDGKTNLEEFEAGTNPQVNEPAAAVSVINGILIDDGD